MTDIRGDMIGGLMKRILDLEERNAQLRNFVADFWVGGMDEGKRMEVEAEGDQPRQPQGSLPWT